MYGNHGCILKVDLSTREVATERFAEDFARLFLGGNGLAAKLIYDTVPSDVDAFASGNAIVFTVGPLTDTPVWGTSRGHMASISPLTGLFCDSNYGGKFGAVQKRTGFDAICVTGSSPKPVYLLVSDDCVEIKDADALWGKTTDETIGALEAKEGDGAVCASIGPAGENRVPFANVMCGGTRLGAAGRGGMGAVMGSKNLKAVVVKGSKRTELADADALKTFLREKLVTLRENATPLATLGTPVLVGMINSLGMLGTHNNTRETFDHYEDIDGDLIKEQYWHKDLSCFACPVACGKALSLCRGDHAGEIVKMPEYETIYALGSMLDNHDVESIFDGNHRCNRLGLDTISMGVTLSFVAECMERGIVSERDLGGEVAFGDGAGMVELIGKTARKEGIGELLALGSTRLAEKFGEESRKCLYAVKGLEIAGHSARGLREMSLSYAVSTRGGSHHDARPNYAITDPDPGFEPQPEYVAKSQCSTAVADSLVMCRFTLEKGLGSLLGEDLAAVVNWVTGRGLDVADLETTGERIYCLERLINVGRGVSRQDDTLPYRVINEPIPDGPAKGRYCTQEDLDQMLDRYYELKGWSRDGIPTDEKLKQLELT